MNISVVIPTYKRPDLLNRLVRSIAMQTYLPTEVIIVDDHSGMESEYNKVLLEFENLPFTIKYIVLKKNSGAPTARNTGIKQSLCDWIALVDDDDEWLPTKLESQIEKIISTNDKKLGLVYTWTEARGAGGLESYICNISVSGDAKKRLLETNFIMSASVLVKKEALLKAGLFNIDLPSCQDWDMWVKVALAGYQIDVVEELLTIYHRHGGESIGLSSRAKLGYRMFLESHARSIFRYTGPVNWLKKIVLYIKVWKVTRGQ